MPLGDGQELLADPLQGAEQQDELDNAGIIPFQMPQQPMTGSRCVNGNLVRPDNTEEEPPSTACRQSAVLAYTCQYSHHALGYALRCVPIPPTSKQKLWVLGDASFAPTGEKSQQGIVVYLGITSNQRQGGNLVQWRSSRQHLVAKSTCEAELIAASEALQQGENISIVISEMINASCDIEVQR